MTAASRGTETNRACPRGTGGETRRRPPVPTTPKTRASRPWRCVREPDGNPPHSRRISRCTRRPGTSAIPVFADVIRAVARHLRKLVPKAAHVGELHLARPFAQRPQLGDRFSPALDDDSFAVLGVANELGGVDAEVADGC